MKFIYRSTFLILCMLISNQLKGQEFDSVVVRQLLDNYNTTDSIIYIDHAIRIVDSNNVDVCPLMLADIYRIKGSNETQQGSDFIAHKYLYSAINLYKEHSTSLSIELISKCYYTIFLSYLRQNDTLAMNKTIDEMSQLSIENPSLTSVNYHYNLILFVYYGKLFEYTSDTDNLNKALKYAYEAISLLKIIPIEKRNYLTINSALVYYNLSVSFNLSTHKNKIDSVKKYLHLSAQQIKLLNRKTYKIYSLINLYDAYAWIDLYEKKYESAYENISKVERLLNQAETQNLTVLAEYSELYRFYIEYYKSIGNLDKVIEYLELTISNNVKQFDNDKNKSLNELRIKHQVEKKDTDISFLNLQLEQQKDSMRLVVVIVTIVVLLMALTIVLVVMRKRNIDQHHFEAALLAENKHETQSYTDQIILDKLKNDYPEKMHLFNKIKSEHINEIVSNAKFPLTAMEKKYIICFMAGIKSSELAEMFFVEPTTVYSVKYRIKKKYSEIPFPF